jgi:peptide/nickel transport system permease protein
MLLTALQSQDMYLAGAILLLLSILTVIGTLISDILLAWLDPRIRFN